MRIRCLYHGLLAFCLFIGLSFSLRAEPIESGQYWSGILATNIELRTHRYKFYVASNDSVIVRAASSDALYQNVPDFHLLDPTGAVVHVASNEFIMHDAVMTNVAQEGWYNLECRLPSGLFNISNTFTYSVSMLRMVDYALSYQDLDVGAIYSGKSLQGTVNVGADLDAAFFSVTNPCTVQVRMGQENVNLVPKLQLYGPQGQLIIADDPQDYLSEITTYITATGIYTVVVNDNFNAIGPYSICMARIPGPIDTGDPDIGPIVSGDTLSGTINAPGDLDIATFFALSGDEIRLAMRELNDANSALNPRIELYSPSGVILKKGADPFQVNAVISNTCTTSGAYYVICKDSQDRFNVKYTLSFDIISGTTLSNVPPIPAAIAASDGTSSNTIIVTWESSTGATGYDIWRAFSTNDYVQLNTNYAAASYSDYNIQPNLLYQYKVKARNSFGVSGFSTNDSGYAASEFASSNRRALLVGINRYDPAYGAGPLNACINDANGVRDTMLLGDPERRWATNAVQVVTDSQASKVSIRNMMHLLAYSTTTNDIVLYYQSSHGGQVAGADTFICTYNANYTDVEFAADLALFNPQTFVFVILDTCYSGGMFKSGESWQFAERVMQNMRRIKADEYLRKGAPVPKGLGYNIAFITAADYNEFSMEGASNGVFTGFMLGACGSPKADSNRNGQYEFSELYSYAYPRALAVYSGQHAQFYNWDLLAWGMARARGAGTGRPTLWPECDFNGDGFSDLTAYNIYTGEWYIKSRQQGVLAWGYPWGGAGHYPVSGDFDGDNNADIAVYNPAQGRWHILSMDGRLLGWDIAWGGKSMVPVCADFNGDRKTDIGAYNAPDGFWYIRDLAGSVLVNGISWTGTGYDAVPGDYNGDGCADYALYHEASGYWHVRPVSGTNIIVAGVLWGSPGLVPVSGDYDGDGISDLAVFNTVNGQWFVLGSDGTILAWMFAWGTPDFMPVPGDFDGDGASDLTVYNPWTGEWYSYSLAGNYIIIWQELWGGYGFVPALPTW